MSHLLSAVSATRAPAPTEATYDCRPQTALARPLQRRRRTIAIAWMR